MTYTELRKKISRRAMILATIILVALVSTLLPLITPLPPYLSFLFPPFIWGRIGVMNGAIYAMATSVIVCIIIVFPLLLWGWGYQQKARYALHLRMWYGLFVLLLLYNWFLSVKIHVLNMIQYLSETQKPSPYPLPPFSLKDQFISQDNNEPPLLSWLFVIYIIPLIIYTAESIYMLRLLRRAKKYEEDQANADESFLD